MGGGQVPRPHITRRRAYNLATTSQQKTPRLGLFRVSLWKATHMHTTHLKTNDHEYVSISPLASHCKLRARLEKPNFGYFFALSVTLSTLDLLTSRAFRLLSCRSTGTNTVAKLWIILESSQLPTVGVRDVAIKYFQTGSPHNSRSQNSRPRRCCKAKLNATCLSVVDAATVRKPDNGQGPYTVSVVAKTQNLCQ